MCVTERPPYPQGSATVTSPRPPPRPGAFAIAASLSSYWATPGRDRATRPERVVRAARYTAFRRKASEPRGRPGAWDWSSQTMRSTANSGQTLRDRKRRLALSAQLVARFLVPHAPDGARRGCGFEPTTAPRVWSTRSRGSVVLHPAPRPSATRATRRGGPCSRPWCLGLHLSVAPTACSNVRHGLPHPGCARDPGRGVPRPQARSWHGKAGEASLSRKSHRSTHVPPSKPFARRGRRIRGSARLLHCNIYNTRHGRNPVTVTWGLMVRCNRARHCQVFCVHRKRVLTP